MVFLGLFYRDAVYGERTCDSDISQARQQLNRALTKGPVFLLDDGAFLGVRLTAGVVIGGNDADGERVEALLGIFGGSAPAAQASLACERNPYPSGERSPPALCCGWASVRWNTLACLAGGCASRAAQLKERVRE